MPVDASGSPAARNLPDVGDPMAGVAETIKQHLEPLAAQVRRTAELGDRLAEKADTGTEEIHRLREKLTTLPEITSAAVESLGGLEERLESLDGITARSAEHLARTARELEEIKTRLVQLEQAIAHCQEASADVAGQQEQIGKSFATIHELVERDTELAIANGAVVKSLADDRSTRYDELRDHLAEQYRKLAVRNTIGLLASAVAAIAAITAAVLMILEHP
jgi:chromosome segregation ATPase